MFREKRRRRVRRPGRLAFRDKGGKTADQWAAIAKRGGHVPTAVRHTLKLRGLVKR